MSRLIYLLLSIPSVLVLSFSFALWTFYFDSSCDASNLRCQILRGSLPFTFGFLLACNIPPFVAYVTSKHLPLIVSFGAILAGGIVAVEQVHFPFLATASISCVLMLSTSFANTHARLASMFSLASLVVWCAQNNEWELAFCSALALTCACYTIDSSKTFTHFSLLPLVVTGGAFYTRVDDPSRAHPLLLALLTNAWGASPLQSDAFSLYSFGFVWPTLERARVNIGIELGDLPPLPNLDSPLVLYSKLEAILDSASPLGGFALLDSVCRRIQPGTFWTSMLHGWTFLILMTIDPLLLHALLSTDPGSNRERDVILVCLLSVSMFVRVSCMEVCFYYSVRCMSAARSATLMAAINKSLSALDLPTNLANLVSGDADKLGASRLDVIIVFDLFFI